MPTLTLRIDENSQDHRNLEKVKEIFGHSSSTKAIYHALHYASEYKERKDRLSEIIEHNRTLEEELKSIKSLIRRQNELTERLNEISLKE